MRIFRSEEENMRKSINNVLEKLNLCLGSYKVCECKTDKRGIQGHLDPFEQPDWTQPRFVSKLNLESQNSQGSHRGSLC